MEFCTISKQIPQLKGASLLFCALSPAQSTPVPLPNTSGQTPRIWDPDVLLALLKNPKGSAFGISRKNGNYLYLQGRRAYRKSNTPNQLHKSLFWWVGRFGLPFFFFFSIFIETLYRSLKHFHTIL